ncbi:MAG TPA: hypothetical protein PKE04_21605, partial [Clostridia bacterium]|nr:hypothetical protein [Clostridia bacterium]
GALRTDDWAFNLLEIARTQLGYRESELNYRLDEAGEPCGYTRYGAWYGRPYDNWSAMFIAFCLHYAQIPPEALHASADNQAWTSLLEMLALYKAAADYSPKA